MEQRASAESWVQQQLDAARVALREQPPGPRDLSIEEYEDRLRGMAAASSWPTDRYPGVSLDQARAEAARAGDQLCLHRGETGHRADWLAHRVHLELGPDDVVREAWRDALPWSGQSPG